MKTKNNALYSSLTYGSALVIFSALFFVSHTAFASTGYIPAGYSGYGDNWNYFVNGHGTQLSVSNTDENNPLWFWQSASQEANFIQASPGDCGSGEPYNAPFIASSSFLGGVIYEWECNNYGTSDENAIHYTSYPSDLSLYYSDISSSSLEAFILAGESPTISFVPPPANGTTTIPLTFLNATTSNLIATHTYAISSSWYANGQTYNGVQAVNTGDYFSRFGYSTPFQQFNSTIAQNISVIAYANIADLTTGGSILASTSIQFWQIPYCAGGFSLFPNLSCIMNGTSTVLNNEPIYIQATSTTPVTTPWDGTTATSTQNGNGIVDTTSTAFCIHPTDITDIGSGLLYAGCQLINITFIPPDNFMNTLTQKTDIAKSEFPIADIISFEQASVGALNTVSSTDQYDNLKFVLSPQLIGGHATTTIVIMDSNIMTEAGVPTTLKDEVWAIIENVLWFATVCAIIFILVTP